MRKNGATRDFKIFRKISERWGITFEQQLKILNICHGEDFWNFSWGKKIPPKKLLERLLYIRQIYIILHILLPDSYAADTWPKKPNKARFLNGQSAFDRILSGKIIDLRKIRDYLVAQLV